MINTIKGLTITCYAHGDTIYAKAEWRTDCGQPLLEHTFSEKINGTEVDFDEAISLAGFGLQLPKYYYSNKLGKLIQKLLTKVIDKQNKTDESIEIEMLKMLKAKYPNV